VHPNTLETFESISTAVNSGKISMNRIVAIGETGLDYFRYMVTSQYIDIVREDKLRQEKLFREQVEFAIRHGLPLMLHIRSSADEAGVSTNDAHNDALKILKEYKDELGDDADKLKLHCHFTTFGIEVAQRFIELDERVTFGIPGVVTYKNAKDLQELVQWLPVEKILSETDTPYAAPVPHRGQRNEPVFVIDTINVIADLRDEDIVNVRESLLKNANSTFGLL
jgi:TatD DNase family protein